MSEPLVKPAVVVPRLPCRGCLPGCANYKTCDGKLWRQQRPGDPKRH